MGKILRSEPDRPLSRLQYVWRLAIPLWMFRDASRGSSEQRSASYRYNRAMRKVLPFYFWKWVGIALCMLQLTRVFSGLMQDLATETTGYWCATLACMSTGIGFAFACVVTTVLLSSYLFLTHVRS